MRTIHICVCLLIATAVQLVAQTNTTQTQDQGTDATQSFASALGLGTGATLAVSEKGTSVTASVERQISSSNINFWQLAISGTTNKNGQATVFSSHEADAPGFKGKIGFGKSSFIRQRPIYTATGGDFLRAAWCRDLLSLVNKTLTSPAVITRSTTCAAAVAAIQNALNAAGGLNAETRAADKLVVDQLVSITQPPNGDIISLVQQASVCNALKAQATFYQFCPDSGKTIKSVEDQRGTYPELYNNMVLGQPSAFQWKAWLSWAPAVTSTDYRAVNNGVADLATKLHWTQLLNTGVGDLAFYFRKVALGVEGGFGQTVQITTQNVCNNITSGTFTSQKCDTAMIGKPKPTNAWVSSATLEIYPLPIFGHATPITPGIQAVFSYTAPTTGGHSSELAVPIFLAPTVAPMKFVFGVQPTWDWNTDPKVGKKFAVTLFVGARPEITK